MLGVTLRSKRHRLSKSLPGSAHARNLYIPRIQRLVPFLNYTDVSLANDLYIGMPIAGVITRASAPLSEVTEVTANVHGVESSARLTVTSTANSISKSTGARLKQKMIAGQMSTIEKRGPARLTTDDANSAIPSPMFRISEQRGLQEAKFRLINDFKRSNINKTVQATSTYLQQRIDPIVALTRVRSANGANDLKQRPIDPPHAY